jgi:hypothetical protein
VNGPGSVAKRAAGLVDVRLVFAHILQHFSLYVCTSQKPINSVMVDLRLVWLESLVRLSIIVHSFECLRHFCPRL